MVVSRSRVALISSHPLLVYLMVTMSTTERYGVTTDTMIRRPMRARAAASIATGPDATEDGGPTDALASGAIEDGGPLQACFPPGTFVILGNHSAIPIESVVIGMRVARGGVVRGTLQLDGRDQELYDVRGVRVSGSHVIKDPKDQIWKRASDIGMPGARRSTTLYTLITEKHRVWLTAEAGRVDPGHRVEAADYLDGLDEPDWWCDRNVRELNVQSGRFSRVQFRCWQLRRFLGRLFGKVDRPGRDVIDEVPHHSVKR